MNFENPESQQQQLSADPDPVMTLISRGEYRQAESLARNQLIEQPDNLALLERIDIALNGQGKMAEAEMVRLRMLAAWRPQENGSRVGQGVASSEAAWMRIVEQHGAYRLVVSEYYAPAIIGEAPLNISVYYQCRVYPVDEKGEPLTFRLEHSNLIEDYYVLRAILPSGGRQLVVYGNRKPTLRQLADDLVNYLSAAGYE